jgi:16S rRNA A1518/A1519 N6-dimethyltransferase RsmA/KsgA/DIM1 with predicted DNA glycosylase/AP lyase activity
MENQSDIERYERAIDVDSETTHARIVRLVGSDRRVLELGPASGHMSRVLRDRGCSVVGIEVDP